MLHYSSLSIKTDNKLIPLIYYTAGQSVRVRQSEKHVNVLGRNYVRMLQQFMETVTTAYAAHSGENKAEKAYLLYV